MSAQFRQSQLASHAARMRSWPSPSEARLWQAIRARQVLGVQFRRQVVVGGKFIVDFFAAQAGLVVEVDGKYHERRQQADEARDRKLERLGYRVVRLEAQLVMEQLPVAVQRVREALRRE